MEGIKRVCVYWHGVGSKSNGRPRMTELYVPDGTSPDSIRVALESISAAKISSIYEQTYQHDMSEPELQGFQKQAEGMNDAYMKWADRVGGRRMFTSIYLPAVTKEHEESQEVLRRLGVRNCMGKALGDFICVDKWIRRPRW